MKQRIGALLLALFFARANTTYRRRYAVKSAVGMILVAASVLLLASCSFYSKDDLNNAYDEGYYDGYDNGRYDGLAEGKGIGYSKGYDECFDSAYTFGYEEGYHDAEAAWEDYVEEVYDEAYSYGYEDGEAGKPFDP